jgi:hypothetical protein
LPQQNLDQFCQLVLKDTALQRLLEAAPDLDTFLTLMPQLGAERGYTFTIEEVKAALRVNRRAWLERSIPQVETLQPCPNYRSVDDFNSLKGWAPIRLYWQQGHPFVDWCYLGQQRFTDPFFDQTIGHCLSHPFNLLFRHHTPIEILAEWQAVQPSLPPTGFIFHMSRCGSTLVAQMLASLPQNIVISEAGVIDTLLRANLYQPHLSDEQRIIWFQGLINALGQRRFEQEKHFFIKFDSWSILDLPLIQRAFPGVPWIFVYRDPVEVMVSHQKQPGSQVVPGLIEPHLFGFEPAVLNQISLNEYCAQVLASLCRAAARYYQPGTTLLINYQQLPEAVYSALLNFWGVDYSAADIERMRQVTQFHAKYPQLDYENDTHQKQHAADDRLRELAGPWLEVVYQLLEMLRQAQKTIEVIL